MRKKMPSYLKVGLIIFASIVVLGGGFLIWKGPALVKSVAQSSLEQSLAPLGIKQVEIGGINFGWGRFYLRDIHSKTSSSTPNFNIQEMDIAFSLFFKIKAVDVIGATLELKESDKFSFSKSDWQGKIAHFGKVISHIKRPDFPTIAMRDCLLVIPSSHGPLKIPVHAVTETTVTRNKVLTIDLGEQGDNKFSGQFILDLGRKGITLDIHTANIDMQTPTFQIKAPEISLWGTTADEEYEGYKVDGFAKLDRLMLARYGSLKAPLEVNLEGTGTSDHLVLDELTVMTTGGGKNLLELEGSFKPYESSGQMILTTQITQLSKLWDFTPLLAAHGKDKVSVAGKVNLTGELFWDKGHLKTSVLAIDVKGGAIIRDGFSIEGIKSQVLFNTLKPITTKNEQRISATKLTTSGIDLKNVVFECLFDSKGLFQINKFTAETLGGSLKAYGFQRDVKLSTPAFQFEADFENIELANILRLTDLKDLSGHAKLAGNASMSYTLGEGLDVLQAELHSVSDSGLLQYTPQNVKQDESLLAQKEVNMAFQVLDNLNFTLFNVRLEHVVNNPTEMQGIVKMLGSNPKVLNGYPFEFNIVTTGKLKDLVINTLHHMKPPTDLNEINKAIKESQEASITKESKEASPGGVVDTGEEIDATIPKPKPLKSVRAAKSIKKARRTRGRAKVIRSRKTLRIIKKVKKVKAIKTIKQENRKLSDG